MPRCRARVGHALGVVAGAGGDDAAAALGLVEVRDPVVGAAQLEAEDRLHVLALEQHRPSQPRREPRRRLQRRLVGHVVDAAGQDGPQQIRAIRCGQGGGLDTARLTIAGTAAPAAVPARSGPAPAAPVIQSRRVVSVRCQAPYFPDHPDPDRPGRRAHRRLRHQHHRPELGQHHPALQPDLHPHDPDDHRAAAVRHAGRRHRRRRALQGRRPDGPAGDDLLRGGHHLRPAHRPAGGERAASPASAWCCRRRRARRRSRPPPRPGTRSCCTWCRPRSSRRWPPATCCRSSSSACSSPSASA